MPGDVASPGGGIFDVNAEDLRAMFCRHLRRGRTVVVRQTVSMPDEEHISVQVTAEVSGRRRPSYEVRFTAPWRRGAEEPDLTVASTRPRHVWEKGSIGPRRSTATTSREPRRPPE